MKGTFYPNKLENKDYLLYYSKFFKFVEVDSTYYHISSRSTVRGWKDKTPDENSNIRDILIAFNNYFAGFGPQSGNDFLKLMNMSEIDWKAELENITGRSNDRHQSSLSDFNR